MEIPNKNQDIPMLVKGKDKATVTMYDEKSNERCEFEGGHLAQVGRENYGRLSGREGKADQSNTTKVKAGSFRDSEEMSCLEITE